MTSSPQTLLREKKHRITATITAVFIAYALLAYGISPHYTWFELHRTIMAIGVVFLGFVIFPPGFFLLFIGTSSIFNLLGALIYFASAGILVGKTLYALYHKGWVGKVVLSMALILNSGFGLFIAAWGNVLVKENPAESCERFVSPQKGIRIVKFDQMRILPGGYHFYLFTQDGGKTWRQLFWDDEDDNVASNCQTLQALYDNFFWMWSWKYLRVSHDGGLTWEAWDWECCTHGSIRQVEFQTETLGTMSVYPGQGSITELTTQDGGRTWIPNLSP